MRQPDPELPWAISRQKARAAGMTDRQVERRLESRRWLRERRGWYRSAESGSEAREFAVEILAALRSVPTRDLVISHLSAARVWGLPRPLSGWTEPTFTASSGATRYGAERTIQVAPLPGDQVTSCGSLAVTTVARTVADCLRALPARDGLALLDAALRHGQVTAAEVTEVIRFQKGWPGIRQAREVGALGDGRRESPLESWSAWEFARLELPQPDWQVQLFSAHGLFLGRADAWWPGVVGEADGRVKYRLRAAERGGASPEVLTGILDDERRREQEIRATGADVQRWGTTDLFDGDRALALAARLRGAIRLAAAHPRFTGTAVPTPHP